MLSFKIKKGSIAWEYIAGLVIVLLLIIIFAMMSTHIRGVIINYLKDLFKGSFWS